MIENLDPYAIWRAMEQRAIENGTANRSCKCDGQCGHDAGAPGAGGLHIPAPPGSTPGPATNYATDGAETDIGPKG